MANSMSSCVGSTGCASSARPCQARARSAPAPRPGCLWAASLMKAMSRWYSCWPMYFSGPTQKTPSRCAGRWRGLAARVAKPARPEGKELREVARLARGDRAVVGVVAFAQRSEFEAAEPSTRVGLPAALGVLAVVDDVDAAFGLQADDFVDGVLDARSRAASNGSPSRRDGHGVAQVSGGAGCRRGGENPIGAALHPANDTAAGVSRDGGRQVARLERPRSTGRSTC